MGFSKWVKKKSAQATKSAGKRYGISYGRRGVRASKNSMSKIAKDVMMIKSQLNVEKKYIDTAEVVKGTCGQVKINDQGFLALDLTPTIPQGVAESQRVGNSIKATGMVLKMNTIKQQSAGGPRRLRILIIKSLDPTLGANSIANKMFDANPLSGVVDYHSNYDYTQISDKRLRVLREVKLYLGNNNDNSTNANPAEVASATRTIALKLDDVLRFQTNGAGEPENVKYYAIVLCDNGNSSGTASTLSTIFCTEANSGVLVNAHNRFWYVDN